MPHDPITLAWLVWLVYWIAAALHAKPVACRESPASRAAFWIPLLVGAALLAMNSPANWHRAVAYPLPFAARYATGLALVSVGIALSIWTRVRVGGDYRRDVPAIIPGLPRRPSPLP